MTIFVIEKNAYDENGNLGVSYLYSFFQYIFKIKLF